MIETTAQVDIDAERVGDDVHLVVTSGFGTHAVELSREQALRLASELVAAARGDGA